MTVNADANGVVLSESTLTEDQLAGITSFDDALALVNEAFGGEIVEADKVLGTGFGVADEKLAYVGKPFIILKADKNLSEMVDKEGNKRHFWSLHCVTQDGTKVIINDGGTGICEQIDTLYARHPELMGKPMMVRKGLRMSNYTHPEHGPSVTFYLDTSAKA